MKKELVARKLKDTGFCPFCGARYPDLIGQGKCDKCIPAFRLLDVNPPDRR